MQIAECRIFFDFVFTYVSERADYGYVSAVEVGGGLKGAEAPFIQKA